MQTPTYRIVAGMVITIIFFLLLGFFIFLLVAYINRRKKRFIEEKLSLQAQFDQQLMQSRLEIQHQTFNEISEEIHDNVGQLLSVTSIQLNIAAQLQDGNIHAIQTARESLSKAMTDLRQLARGLSADRVGDDSLVTLVRQQLEKIGQTGLYKTSFTSIGDERDYHPHQKLIIYRMLQESLQNIIRHAAARNIQVKLDYGEMQLLVSVIDDGQGFIADNPQNTAGIGLRNISKRAEVLGGTVVIESAPGSGTTIKFMLPYPNLLSGKSPA